MSTLPKSLRLSIEDSARPDPFSSDDQIDDGSSLDSLEPLDTLAFNSPFAPFASQWGSAMYTSASSGNTQHGGGTVDRVVSQTVASAPVAPAAAGATAAAAHSAIVADGRVASPGGSGLVFNNSFESSCSAQFEACVVAAEKTLEGLFTNPVVFNVSFNEKNEGDSSDLASNTPGTVIGVVTDPNLRRGGGISYANFKNALPSSDVLPASLPSGGLTISEAYARMLGLSSSTESTDATVTLNSSPDWSYGQDVANVVIHELSEFLMGRVGGLGDPGNVLGAYGLWSTMDLFRYKATGGPDYSDGRDGQTTYFSSDGGKTTSQSAHLSFNNEYNSSGKQVNQGDTADFTQQSVFGTGSTGETITLTQTELNVMEALGWKAQITQDCFTGSGNWQTPTNWSSSVNDGATPIEPQDAYVGANYADVAATATSLDDVIVNSIGTNAASTLTISGGSTLTATNGTVLNASDRFETASGNNGAIVVEDASGLLSGGAFDNAGVLTIEGLGSFAEFSGAVTNSGSIYFGVDASADLGGVVTNNGMMMVGAQATTGDEGVLFLTAATTLSGGGALDMGQITAGFSTDIAKGGGGNNGGGGGHPVFFESSGEIFGGAALVNVNNTISGAGLISVKSFDNQAAASAGASFAGNTLQIESSVISNEGELFADAQTILDLGFDGSAASLFNSGEINLAAGADLLIAGNLTAAGTGSINLNGASSALTSDGFEANTFTNAAAIVATASAEIGDAGIKSVNDLSLTNQGSIVAEGSGTTLTLNTGANTIVDQGGLIEAESGAQLTIDSAVQTTQLLLRSIEPPAESTIEAASGGVVNINASITDVASLASQVNGPIVIDGGTVNVAAGVSLGVPVTFTGAGGTLNLANAPVDVDVNGAGGAINLSHANADVTGGGFTITETGADWLAIGGNGVGGATDVVTGSGETTTTHSNSNVTIVGNHDTVDVGVANVLSLEGANDVLDLHELFGDTTLSGFGASDLMEIGNSDFADFQLLQGHMTQSGANTLITLDAHDVIKLTNVAASSLTASQFRFA